jgi:predicted nicotinamide N-methyase
MSQDLASSLFKQYHNDFRRSCRALMHPAATVYVVFSHHVPRKAAQDMALFDAAKAMGFSATHLKTDRYPPMFEKDCGDLDIRSQVHFYVLSLIDPSAPIPTYEELQNSLEGVK